MVADGTSMHEVNTPSMISNTPSFLEVEIFVYVKNIISTNNCHDR